MSLSDQLLYIYPDLDLGVAVRLQADESVGFIAHWGDPRPQPMQSELDAAVVPAKRKKLETDIDTLVAEKIAGLFGKPPHSIELIVKQQNYQARVTELLEKEAVGLKRLAILQEIVINGGTLTGTETTEKEASLLGVLTETEQTEKSTIQGLFTLIKSIRMYGKTLVANLATVDPDTFKIDIGWPV